MPISFLEAKKVTLLNFTGSSYHWGCYATSMEIYQSLLEEGYYVEIIDVSTTHGVSPTVSTVGDFDDAEFFKNFAAKNSRLMLSLQQSDKIVVNGEGTLHRLSKGALNLLYIMYICKKHLRKCVHLINFSCYPNGDETAPNGLSSIYPNVLKYLNYVTPRDHVSTSILDSSNVKTTQAFDCLPRFLDRYKFCNTHSPNGYILVSGGVFFEERRYELLKSFICHFIARNISVKFLLGAHFSMANEDIKLQERLRAEESMQNLTFIKANSLIEWVGAFQNASFLFSSRFHHTIAALAIGTPFNYQRSNTPKISAVLDTLSENTEDLEIGEAGLEALIVSAEEALKTNQSNQSIARVNKMLSLAKNNFIDL